MKKVLACLLGLSVFLLVACGLQTPSTKKDIQVVTTFYPVYEFTKQVVGEEADVSLLVKAGTEPHDFEPSAKNIAEIQEADVFVYENENMETWVTDVLKSVDTKKVNVIKATEGMLLLPGGEEADHEHDEDGHHHDLSLIHI